MSEETPQEYNDKSLDAVLARLEQKVDTLILDTKEIKLANKDVTRRVSILENYKYYFSGLIIGITTLFNWFFKDLFGK